jgi:DNA-binding transcriptional LysR family regulator
MNPRKLRDHVEKLNIFLEVCRAKSFHGAARKLGLSQPSLSQAVKILEDTLETRLLIRSQKGIELTQTGEKLYYFSERLVSEVDGLENRLRSPDQPMIGSLNLGTYATLTSYLLPKFLVQMSKKYKQLSLGVTTLKADELSGALTTRRCHFVIGSVEFKQKTITQFEIYQDHFGFFCGKNFTQNDLKESPLIFVANARDGEGQSIGKTLSEANLGHLHRYDVDNFESVRALVSEGLGTGVLPLRLAESYVQNKELISVSMPRLGKKFGMHKFYCSLLTQDLDDPRISTILNELRSWCRNI